MRRVLRAAALTGALATALLAGCRPKPLDQPDLGALIDSAVAATVEAMPQPTVGISPTAAPTLDLAGLFCEYEFCIGHPSDVPLFDARRESSSADFSSYGSGRVAGYRPDGLFLLTAWVSSAGSWDPAGMMKTLEDEFGVSPTGDYKIDLIQHQDVAYQPTTPPANSIANGGLTAAWRCGDRDFIWIVFTSTPDQAAGLLNDALAKFRCSSP
jgi:hypothetical protein